MSFTSWLKELFGSKPLIAAPVTQAPVSPPPANQGEPPAKLFEATDAEMDALALELGGRWFHSKIVGVTYRNEDGTRRQELIEETFAGNELDLVHDPDNEHDPNAVKVENSLGQQLGFLDSRLAGEVTRARKKGVEWRCFFMRQTGGFDGERVGAVIAVLRCP